MLRKREEIKQILDSTNEAEEIREELSLLNTVEEIGASRVINVGDEVAESYLELETGDTLTELGHSWTNMDTEYPIYTGFAPENTSGGNLIVLQVEGVSGYEVQYFDENIHEEEVVEKMEQDTVYQDLLTSIDSDMSYYEEAEVLISNKTKFIVDHVEDGRDYMGYILITMRPKQ